MGNNQTEKAFEEKRLAQTISLAEEQLKQAKEAADKKKSEIIEAKKDVRENTEHGITSLYTSDGFEALVELSQYINPVTDKIIDYEEEEHKILLLEKMIKSPYFARIDFKFDDEDEFEKIYIGRSSLRNEAYFYSLLQNSNPSQNIKNIWKYTKENLEADSLYYDDAIAIAYLYLKIYGTNKYKNIKQVVIDEAQDYYPLQYEIFNLLFSNAKFTILGDMKQTLAKKEDISFYEQIQKILNKKKSSLIMLDKSFRCTNEILNFSLKFIEQSSQIKSFNRNGDSPKVYIADNSEIFIDEIVKEIKLCQEKGFQSICLICKTEKNSTYLFNKIKHKLDIQLIKNGSVSDLQGVFILPVYMSKGLEFDTVLICDADSQNYHDEDDKNLLYVACTRALHKLSLFCENEVSPLI